MCKDLGKIYNLIGIFSLFEIHLVNKKDWKIYKKLIKNFLGDLIKVC